MSNLPTGTVTFLFTDIEGSAELWHAHPDAMPAALARHHAVVRKAIEDHQGSVFQVVGDAFCAAFANAPAAVEAALEIQRELNAATPADRSAAPAGNGQHSITIRVRIGIHTGAAETRGADYLSNPTLIRVQRVMSAGHGGQILLSDATEALSRDLLPDTARLQDLGRHRLKGLARPEHLFQLSAPGLRSEFPPLRTVDVRPNNLPTALSSFIGRESEIAEVKRLLQDVGNASTREAPHAHARLVTLTGVGGTGKTRLALQVAAEMLEPFPHGVWLVELAPLADPDLVPQAVASALNLREQPGMTLLEALTDFLRARQLLLVLDNCEHLVEACARLMEALLHSCPNLAILATSREAIGITGERTWYVPPLSWPDPLTIAQSGHEQLSRYESVRLFVDRARAAQPAFALTTQNALPVAQICRQLDGIPLAIELAAARLTALSVEQIAARLDDRFNLLTLGSRTAVPRQQTLRATIDWSYDLLPDNERRLFRRLSVFAGGWTLEAAEYACGLALAPAANGAPAAAPATVLDVLSQLVNKSLVVMVMHDAEMRFHFLETIRQYAQERLIETGEAPEVHRRHRDFFLQLVERLEPSLRSADQVNGLNRLETERDNLWLAMDWSLEQGEPLEGLRMAGSLQRFFYLRVYWSKGREWLQQMLAAVPAPPEAPGAVMPADAGARQILSARAKALAGLGWLANDNGDQVEPYRESLALCRRLNDRWGAAFALRGLGVSAYVSSDYAQGRALLDESLSLFQALHDDWGVGLVRFNQGWLAFERDERRQAQVAWDEALTSFRRSTDRWGIAVTLGSLSYVARLYADDTRAKLLAQESLALYRELGDKAGISDSLSRLGGVAYRHEDLKQATALLQESLALQRDVGYDRSAAETLAMLGHIALLRGDYRQAVAMLGESHSLSQDLAYERGVARALGLLGLAAFDQGQLDRAREHWEQSLSLFQAEKDDAGSAPALNGLGRLALAQSDPERAETLLQASLGLSQRAGERQQTARTLNDLGEAARARGDLPRAAELMLQGLSLRREAGARRSIAESLESLSALFRLRQEPALAVRLAANAAALRDALGAPLPPLERRAQERDLADLRARLGSDFDAAWAAGRALSAEQAVELATRSVQQPFQTPG